MTSRRLMADIGGTNIRFAQSSEAGRFEHRRTYRLKNHENFHSAFRTYQSEVEINTQFEKVFIGAAGLVSNGKVELTNSNWVLNGPEISEIVDQATVVILNDLEAVACALPYLGHEALVPIGDLSPSPDTSKRKLAVNVGTGFGAASLVWTGTTWLSCSTEAGHMSLCAETMDDLSLLEGLVPPAKSVEDILSGQGLVKLYNFQKSKSGGHSEIFSSADVLNAVNHDDAAKIAVDDFTRLLGRVVGDLALALGCWGGVYMVGGVIEGWSLHIDDKLFRHQFENKGKMQDLQKSIYTGVVTKSDISLIGLTYA